MEEVNAYNFAEVVLAPSVIPYLVDFWAPWCAPCLAMAPNLKRLADEYEGRLVVVKVNIQDNPSLQDPWGIHSIPALVVFRGGKEVARSVGSMPLPKLRALVAPFLLAPPPAP